MRPIVCYSIFFISFVVVIPSCKKEVLKTNVGTSMGYDYYPLIIGKYIIYNVTQITIDVQASRYDTVKYQLRELLVDTIFSNNKDVTLYKLERYRTISPDSVAIDVWQVWKQPNRLVRVEANVPIVKQIYPMKTNQVWNTAQFNTLDSATATVYSMDMPDTVNTMPFDSVATIKANDFESLFQKTLDEEKYVRGIGLVSKRVINVESQSYGTTVVDLSQPIMNRVTKGTISTWTIVSHN